MSQNCLDVTRVILVLESPHRVVKPRDFFVVSRPLPGVLC